MPEQIIGSPTQHMWAINNSGAGVVGAYSGGTIYPLLVDSAGKLETTATVTGSLVIGSVSVSADTVFIQSGANMTGSFYIIDTIPTATIKNNVEWEFLYSGNSIGSVVQHIGAGSYVSVWSYTGDNLTSIGSYT